MDFIHQAHVWKESTQKKAMLFSDISVKLLSCVHLSKNYLCSKGGINSKTAKLGIIVESLIAHLSSKNYSWLKEDASQNSKICFDNSYKFFSNRPFVLPTFCSLALLTFRPFVISTSCPYDFFFIFNLLSLQYVFPTTFNLCPFDLFFSFDLLSFDMLSFDLLSHNLHFIPWNVN